MKGGWFSKCSKGWISDRVLVACHCRFSKFVVLKEWHKGREWQREKESARASKCTCVFHLLVHFPKVARAEARGRVHIGVGTHVLEPSCSASTVAFVRNWLGSRRSRLEPTLWLEMQASQTVAYLIMPHLLASCLYEGAADGTRICFMTFPNLCDNLCQFLFKLAYVYLMLKQHILEKCSD